MAKYGLQMEDFLNSSPSPAGKMVGLAATCEGLQGPVSAVASVPHPHALDFLFPLLPPQERPRG